MKTHFDILIDASGSMGLLKDKDGNPNLDYLLSDGITTRTELVKHILINTIIPKLSYVDSIKVSTFSSPLVLNQSGNPLLKAGNKQYSPKFGEIFDGKYNLENINSSINEIKIPSEAGTPLSWATCVTINQSKQENINIIIISDGDDSVTKIYDEIILKTIGSKNCKIYFIGIAQNDEAATKSKKIAVTTGGKYVNLDTINYDKLVFENFLFDINTTITSNAIKESLKIKPPIVENIIEKKDEVKKEPEIIEGIKNEPKLEKEVESTDIKRQVAENTKSLQLISSQLDQIVKQVSFIGNKSKDEDEFEANEDEEFNKLVGNKTERILFDVLKSKWKDTTWLNENGEQGKPYDFEVLFEGQTYYMECKGTIKNIKEFFLTKNEWLFYLANRKYYRLYFVSEINSQNPTIHRIEDLLKDMEEGKLISCSSINRKVKTDRILFQIID